MHNVTLESHEEYEAKADLQMHSIGKSTRNLVFRVEQEQYVNFKRACDLLGKTRTQVVMSAIRATIIEARHHAAQQVATGPPRFEMLTIEEARVFLAPYYGGNPPSARTIERRIEDGLLVAVQDHDSRTTPLRILKASLVQWMARLGRKLESEMM